MHPLRLSCCLFATVVAAKAAADAQQCASLWHGEGPPRSNSEVRLGYRILRTLVNKITCGNAVGLFLADVHRDISIPPSSPLSLCPSPLRSTHVCLHTRAWSLVRVDPLEIFFLSLARLYSIRTTKLLLLPMPTIPRCLFSCTFRCTYTCFVCWTVPNGLTASKPFQRPHEVK